MSIVNIYNVGSVSFGEEVISLPATVHKLRVLESVYKEFHTISA